MSDFNYRPLVGAQADEEPRIRRADFGDGYVQRVGDGINTIMPIWNLQFAGTQTEMMAIRAQLAGYAGVTAFTWTPAGESEIKVICPSWSRVRTTRNVSSLTARFEQVPA